VRNSIAPLQPSQAYRITSSDGGVPALEWLGTSNHSADKLLGGAARTEVPPRDRAVAFLEQFLKDGPRTSRDIWEAAQKAGLSARTLHRAREGLDISSLRFHADGQLVSYWRLPGQQWPASRFGDSELGRYLAELEKQFPPPNPLDLEDDRE
jgi:hypothetical protein